MNLAKVSRALILGATLAIGLMFSVPARANVDLTGAEVTEVGVHVGSIHVPPHHFNDFNPGAYAIVDNDYVVGAYRNSVRKNSLYAAYLAHYQHVDVIYGVATGYNSWVMPMIAPSWKIHITDRASTRLLLLPAWSKGKPMVVVHLTLEWDLR
jgi:hypothetical protein